jgi:hypothetical protein
MFTQHMIINVSSLVAFAVGSDFRDHVPLWPRTGTLLRQGLCRESLQVVHAVADAAAQARIDEP